MATAKRGAQAPEAGSGSSRKTAHAVRGPIPPVATAAAEDTAEVAATTVPEDRPAGVPAGAADISVTAEADSPATPTAVFTQPRAARGPRREAAVLLDPETGAQAVIFDRLSDPATGSVTELQAPLADAEAAAALAEAVEEQQPAPPAPATGTSATGSKADSAD